ncbi:MAG: MCE family protein [Bacteroidetes bacterium]|jgi:phospholipid/cholesterol/gamma-HCH transport system substrate-binding protein|nr:MCE family protein [Bacteroidota bacterium]
MKTTSGQKIKIGGFVLAGLAVLIAGIFLIGNKKGLFTKTFNVHGMFKNVNGLQVGNNARFAGINVGVVKDIQIVNDTTVKVTLTLNEDVRKFVKKDSKLSISSDGLMGDKLVLISSGGVNSNQEVVNGDQLTGVNPFDVDRLVNKFSKIADDAGELVGGLSSIINKVNNGQGSLGRLLNNDKMARDLEGTVKQAKSTIANVHQTTGTLNEDLKAAQSNFLLRGFFKKKKKLEKARQDSIKKAKELQEKNEQQKKDDQKKKDDQPNP